MLIRSKPETFLKDSLHLSELEHENEQTHVSIDVDAHKQKKKQKIVRKRRLVFVLACWPLSNYLTK